MNGPISLLDNDLYKFTMQQAALLSYHDVQAEYVLINRGKTKFPVGFGKALRRVIDKMANLSLTPEELAYMRDIRFMTPGYLHYLESYRYKPEEVVIEQSRGELSVTVVGPWHSAILWEVPLMAAISELYFEITTPKDHILQPGGPWPEEKAEIFLRHGIRFSDFGTRRRFSFVKHKRVLADMVSVDNNTLNGTSNVYLAKRFGLKAIGTQAHEWFMFHGAYAGYRNANRAGMEAWSRIYGKDLGIALTDTFTTDNFLQNFDHGLAELFSGVRHDSGDPFVFANKIIRHYHNLGIEPMRKTIVFSDGLDVEKVLDINERCLMPCAFGIGTSLTNDVGVKPLNIVIKMSRCTVGGVWRPVVKLSDVAGKHTGDPEEIKRCKVALS